MIQPILLIVILLLLGISIYFASKKDNSSTSQSNKSNEKNIPATESKNYPMPYNFITPSEFKIGLLGKQKYAAMNNCIPDTLYPINGPGPEYGWKMPKDCRCTEFVRSP